MSLKFVHSLHLFGIRQCLPQFVRNISNVTAAATSAQIVTPVFAASNRETDRDLAKTVISMRKRRKRPLTASYRPMEMDELVTDAFAYADAYDLTAISDDTKFNMKYQVTLVDDVVDTAIYVTPKSVTSTHRSNADIKELFVFSDGVIVFWNIEANEQNQIADYLFNYATNTYSSQLYYEEAERMPFRMAPKTGLKKDVICLQSDSTLSEKTFDTEEFPYSAAILERYSFSHALATSAKIGVWENQLSEQADPLLGIADALTSGKILWKRKETLKKIGELARLRHSINMTEMLDNDFYWDRPELERHYSSLSKYLTAQHRLNMMNRRLDYCQQLVNTIDNTLTNRHASTLEWMIIILIVIEIIFDSWHFLNATTPPNQSLAYHVDKEYTTVEHH